MENASGTAPQCGAVSFSGGSPLVIRGLAKEYVRGKPILRGINLEIAPNGITAIIGPSGTGKSTLIRCINRLVEPTSGSGTVLGARLGNRAVLGEGNDHREGGGHERVGLLRVT